MSKQEELQEAQTMVYGANPDDGAWQRLIEKLRKGEPSGLEATKCAPEEEEDRTVESVSAEKIEGEQFRRDRRFPLRLHLSIVKPRLDWTENAGGIGTLDVSASGLLIESPLALPVGERLTLKIDLPDEEEESGEIVADLVRITRHPDGRGYLAGLRFVEPNATTQGLLDFAQRYDLSRYLEASLHLGASDIHLVGGHPIQIRCQGELFPLQGEPLDPKEVRFLLDPLMTPEQQEKLQREKQLTFSFEAGKSGRFRVHVHRSGGALCATLRVIPERTHTLSALHLPQRISSVLELGGGIVLVCGSARSGKSTTLCALVNELLHKRGATVSWLQAPLEQTIAPTQGIVKYLEVGEDTPSYAATLASIHLQDPDVVVVNEIEDMESLQALFDLTEAGITVIATTHAGTIPKALHRLSALFPPERRSGACREMAGTLRAVVCQRLLPKRDGNGSVPAVAFMINNAPIRRRIEQGKFDEIPHLLHIDQGMQSFELSIKMLRQDGLIDPDTAASHLGMLSSPIG